MLSGHELLLCEYYVHINLKEVKKINESINNTFQQPTTRSSNNPYASNGTPHVIKN